MRNAVRAALSIGALAMSGVAFGQATGIPGIDFGGNKPLDTSCNFGDAGTCKVIAGGGPTDNFVQRQFAVQGKTYIQTLLADPNAVNGPFSDENYIQLQTGQQGSVQGIADQMIIGAPVQTGKEGFYTNSTITAGWASTRPNGATNALIQLDLAAAETAVGANDYFVSKFSVNTDFDAGANKNTLNGLKIEQDLGLGIPAGVTPTSLPKQEFVTIVQPAKTTQSNVKLVGDPQTTTGISWTTGVDRVQATWVGQDMNAFGAGAFGLENIQNLTSAGGPTITFASNLNSPQPVNWQGATPAMEAEFGLAPTF